LAGLCLAVFGLLVGLLFSCNLCGWLACCIGLVGCIGIGCTLLVSSGLTGWFVFVSWLPKLVGWAICMVSVCV